MVSETLQNKNPKKQIKNQEALAMKKKKVWKIVAAVRADTESQRRDCGEEGSH